MRPESFSPVTDFLDLLPDLVSPEGDEKHHALADLALKPRKNICTIVIALSFSPLNSNLARNRLTESGLFQILFGGRDNHGKYF